MNQQVLHGIVVVSLAQNLPGPLAVRRLADHGAHVVKVEPPDGDQAARAAPQWYRELTAGIEVLTLDLSQDAGRAGLDVRLAAADLLVTSTRPAALARLGLGPADLTERYPRLSHLEIVGSLADPEHSGHDLTYQAQSGTLPVAGLPPLLTADQLGAERAATEAVLALWQAQRTGAGVTVRVGLADAVAEAAAALRHGLTAPTGPLGGAMAGYQRYQAADGEVVLAVLEPHFAQRFTEHTGVPVEAAALAALFRTKTAQQWQAWAEQHDLPLVAVRPALSD